MNTHVFKLTFKIRQHRHTVFFIAPYFRKFRIAKISFYIYGMTVVSIYIPNDDIPVILAVIGAIMNSIVSGISVESIVYGAVMGLASTGMHQAFKRWIENDNDGSIK